jgi:hypothetical protein
MTILSAILTFVGMFLIHFACDLGIPKEIQLKGNQGKYWTRALIILAAWTCFYLSFIF